MASHAVLALRTSFFSDWHYSFRLIPCIAPLPGNERSAILPHWLISASSRRSAKRDQYGREGPVSQAERPAAVSSLANKGLANQDVGRLANQDVGRLAN